MKKKQIKKKVKNQRIITIGLGDHDLELNWGTEPIRIRNIKEEPYT